MVHWIGAVHLAIDAIEYSGIEEHDGMVSSTEEAVGKALTYLKLASDLHEREQIDARRGLDFGAVLDYTDRIHPDKNFVWYANNNLGSFGYDCGNWIWKSNSGKATMQYPNQNFLHLHPDHFPMQGVERKNNGAS